MSKLKQAITDDFGNLTNKLRLIEAPKVNLAKAFAGFYEEVRVEMCKQDAKANQ